MKKYLITLVILYFAIYIIPLGGRPLITPDEYRYAEIPREMIENGDWITPRLADVRYFEKPVMGYWLNAISISLFGENSFAIRLSSAISAGISALLLWMLVRRFSKDEETAWLSTGIFMTCGLVYFVGTFAVLDSPTTMFINGAMICFFFAASEEKWNRFKVIALAMFGIFCGLAFLTKGFLAFAVPVVAIVPYMFWEKRWKELFILPLIPIFTALLVALPWALLIHFRESDYWHYFFWVEHVQRLLGKNQTQHPEPFWLYIPILIGGALPWALLLPCAFISLRKNFRQMSSRPLMRFAICWLVFPFLFFSVSSGKLATYILPCFAPLAIIMAVAMIAYFRTGCSKTFNGVCGFMSWILLAAAAGFTLYQMLANCKLFPELYSSAELWKWALAVVAALIWGIGLYAARHSPKYRMKLAFFMFGPALAFFLSNYIAPSEVLEGKAQGLYLSQFRDRVKPDSILVVHPNVMHAAAWEFRKSGLLFYIHGGELEYGLKYPDAKARIIGEQQMNGIIRKTPAGKLIFIMRGDFREGVPPARFEAYDHGIMFSNF
ncbi:MAG: phospholipid carrier-dependent glycosyltransferase [Lentisphaerota bacterium]